MTLRGGVAEIQEKVGGAGVRGNNKDTREGEGGPGIDICVDSLPRHH